QEARLLPFVLADDEGYAALGGLAHLADDGGQDMIFRSVEDLLCRVETQPVEMVFVDPVASIGEEKFAHRTGVIAIEIDRLTPFVIVAVGEISCRERVEVVTVRTEMVVDDVKDDSDAERVRPIDKVTKLIRLAIEPGRRQQ